MKISIYLSVILGISFLTLRFIGLFLDLADNNLFLFLGLLFLVGIGLPLRLFERHRNHQKFKSIVEKYKQKGASGEPAVSEMEISKKKKSLKKKGIEYPAFRKQKQGLKWSGGNIHGSAATRGAKRSFLKK